MASRRRRAWLRLAAAVVVVVVGATLLFLRRGSVELPSRDAPGRSISRSSAADLLPPMAAAPASRSPDAKVPPIRSPERIPSDAPAPRSPLDPPIVRFQVFDPSGALATRGTIRAVRGNPSGEEPLRESSTGIEWDVSCVEASLPIDQWTIQALATSDAIRTNAIAGGTVHDLLSEKATIQANLGDDPRDVVLRLESHPAIFGVVHGGEKDSYVVAWCRRLTEGVSLDDEGLWTSDARRIMESTYWEDDARDHDCPYAIEGLCPGRYAMTAGSWRRTTSPIIVSLTDRSVRVDLSTPTGPQPGDLFVTVHGPGGTKPGRLEFELASTASAGGSVCLGTVSPELDGRYWLKPGRGWTHARSSTGTRDDSPELRITSEDWGMRRVELRRDQGDVDVIFDAPASLDLKLTHFFAAAGIQVFRAIAVRADAIVEWRTLGKDQVDADGRCLLEGFQPGPCVIGIEWTPVLGQGEKVLREEQLDLNPGANQRTIDLPAFHDLTVVSCAGVFGSPLRVSTRCVDHSEWWATVEAGESADARFDFLPAGTYEVTVKGPLYQLTRRVVLDRSTTIDVSN